MTNRNIPINFEFFPPKTEAGQAKLVAVANVLADEQPEFFSVTYGAGGSTRDGTRRTVLQLNNEVGVPAAPHLSCVGDSREDLRTLLNDYRAQGIQRIVALRGDLPSGMGHASGELRYANELVEFIRAETGDHFKLEVAAYPESHPQAPNFETDLKNFIRKAQAGADSAITQYFFNADCYFHFVDRVRQAGVDIPIIPGIMPITNYSKLARFSDACGAEIPRWIRKQLEAYGDDSDSIKAFGTEVISQLCERLIEGGAPGLHFYTLNQAEPTVAVLRNLRG
ncbi:MAG TPA: methylenetetrahydrofolate reductase [NAD(P)H] [Pseudomonas sp.]|uniref:Methylenetetrahydrofolate reductase n=1 Tax=Halopseudomonas pachastrellae TaxID=254161 RepID=A0A1S8DIQ1_9GAMM|nr:MULTISPECIES: methylenetetrahydrofolate reductase [NAD(P)H] [Halopseudomonas]MAP30859.1 methylenetetrahydrofolate reductase [NAD(P)H] [Pseudomonas sp.]MBB49701.1 methylenetetrahydrofolate reductase [NAD(P)H] [Pseudomonadales bacterium]MAQ51386.1 methylenetetrahydrofolate reductase [NAD(P)H] [Pseudomonas sp.]MBU30190.1 methylenetetrahydrofolate reductase [NAD(P)H] [Pseudomonadales bacterium]ONM44696.1 methylenetetrahydrofolate reductase [NAD(P)H] [Halopseudomonas pachastrellae]|tara:strand:+ start:135 stop:977 length:843 start_codon:yes stop_codon:yes gene_type:complete